MFSRGPTKNRNVLPRWRKSVVAANMNELQSVNKADIRSNFHLNMARVQMEKLIHEWKLNKSIESACDLVACATVLLSKSESKQLYEVRKASNFLTSGDIEAPLALRKAALHLLEDEYPSKSAENKRESIEEIKIYVAIANLKSRVRKAPRDSISWLEMARLYTRLGQFDPARYCVKVATKISPNNRYIIRSAARFYVHIDESDRGLALIQGSRATANDPWLLASEISVASVLKKPSHSLKKSLRYIEQNKWAWWDTAELAGAAATVLGHDGAYTKAKKLFKLSIRNPNENALAQAQWAMMKGWIPKDTNTSWKT